MAGAVIDSDDKRIRASGLYEEWLEGEYQVGDIRNNGGQTWEVLSRRTTMRLTPDIKPDNPAWFTFWRPPFMDKPLSGPPPLCLFRGCP